MTGEPRVRVVGRLASAAVALERLASRILRGRAPLEAPWEPTRLAIVWLLSRLVVIVLVPLSTDVVNDLNYFGTVTSGGSTPDRVRDLSEYPVPAVWLLTIPSLAARGDVAAYGWWFVLLMLVVDALFTAVLQRRSATPRAVTAWLLAGPLLGPLLLVRFDLLPGVAVAVALMLAVTRPRIAAALVVAATVVKLWPAVIVGLVAGAATARRRFVAAAAAVSAAVVVVALTTSGWDRLTSPLAYQSSRGLQVESLLASPLMIAWALRGAAYDIVYAPSLSYEISGPGSGVALLLTSVATVAALAWTAYSTFVLWRRTSGSAAVTAAAWAVLSCTTLLVLANRVFSPQYLLWLTPVAVGVLAITRETRARTCTYLMLGAALAAQALYPLMYGSLIALRPGAGNLLAVALVLLRLVLVAMVAWLATARTWQLLRA